MTEDELGRLLGDALDAHARHAVADDAPRPAPRFAAPSAVPGPDRRAPDAHPLELDGPRHEVAPHRWRRRLVAPLATAAAVLAAVGVGVALSGDDSGHRSVAAQRPTPTAPSSARTVVAPASARPVTVSLVTPASAQVGVGMPVVARFDQRITDARSLAAVTTVTADGRPLDARWYFVRSTAPGYPIEGHLRPRDYWPAHARIAITVHAQRLSAGTGLRFADDLTTTFTTGAATIATVDDRTHLMSIQRDGRPAGQFRVSLGATRTPTLAGVKVIMSKAPSVCMHDVNGTYYSCGIRYAQQITSSGEYLHAAPWNVRNIGLRNTSNGCTNLRPDDARLLYAQLEVGDVVQYPDTGGPEMTLTNGFGDWDVPWSTWVTGGLVPTS